MKKILFALFCTLSLSPLFSQGWERFYENGPNTEIIYTAAQLPDSGFLLGTRLDGSIIRTDPDGHEIWRKDLTDLGEAKKLTPLPNGNFILQGSKSNSTPAEHLIMEITPDGDIVWSKSQVFPFISASLYFTVSDGYCTAYNPNPNSISILKVDLNGDFVFQKEISIDNNIPFADMISAHDGGFIVANMLSSDIILTKFDKDANFEWQKINPIQINGFSDGTNIAQTSDGGYVLNTTIDGFVHFSKCDGDGNLLWENTTELGSPFDGGRLFGRPLEASNGYYIIAGSIRDDITPNTGQPAIFGLSPIGNFEFNFIAQREGTLWDILETAEGNYVASGWAVNEAISIERLGYLLQVDAEGSIYPNLVQGQVAFEEDNDCQISPDDVKLFDWPVKADGPLTFYTLTDENGFYSIPIDTGEYTITITPPNDLWGPCENPLDIVVMYEDTLTADFPVQASIECPSMQVDISRPFLRRCFENTLSVQYCNAGTIIAEDALIEVTLDSLIEYNSSSIPLTGQSGNVYSFELGDVGILECGSFEISTTVSCDAELGQTLCFEAHAFPDTICGTPFNYSGASMVARAKCQGDTSVVLELENVGTVATSQELEYIVIEDHIIFLEGSQIFEPLQPETYLQDANGSTWRIICEQEPNHPGISFPTAFIEGCGQNNSGGINIGYLNEHPLGDGNPFLDIDCEEVVGAFDPNDKSAMPIGYDDEHFIEPNTDIEYRIRFQNTGTDTAFNVVIRDTLSTLLDPATLRPGAASHAYEYDLSGNGVAVFTFPDIMLPDSNVNETLSHGFVTFKISQMPDLEPESMITNSAAIYFDFNEPIITNETFHTIEREFLISVVVDTPQVGATSIKVYPNPFSDQTIFEIENGVNNTYSLNLFDSMGRLMRKENFNGSQLVFQRGDLKDGIWFFNIESEGLIMSSGKLVITGR